MSFETHLHRSKPHLIFSQRLTQDKAIYNEGKLAHNTIFIENANAGGVVIDQSDEILKSWITSIVGNISITTELTPPCVAEPVISAFLMQIVPRLPDQSAPSHSVHRSPLRISLRYLITAHAPDDAQAHHLLGRLIFAALEAPDFEVDLIPLSLVEWAALQTMPRPGFVINIGLTQERACTSSGRPTPVIRLAQSQRRGLVLGPDDRPLIGATVEFPAMKFTTHTDEQGGFHFPDPPSGQPQMIVRAAGHEQRLTLDIAAHDPLIIRLP